MRGKNHFDKGTLRERNKCRGLTKSCLSKVVARKLALTEGEGAQRQGVENKYSP